ncbi:MAG: hypothetical protein M1587_11515 [Thaumarchaeota archaeon]|nr:hypothetical protein [Nitrososphaerota archaeon]
MQKQNGTSFWLSATPGLFGLFGLGHFYLGSDVRGSAFLGYSAILYVLLIKSFLSPWTSSVLWVLLPAMWFVGLVAVMYDVRYVAIRESPRMREHRAERPEVLRQ